MFGLFRCGRRVWKAPDGWWYDPVTVRADVAAGRRQDWVPAFSRYVWEERREGIRSGLAESVATYGPPPGFTYSEWVRCYFALPLVRELNAQVVEYGVRYAAGETPPVEYHEAVNGGDREAAEAVSNELTTADAVRGIMNAG